MLSCIFAFRIASVLMIWWYWSNDSFVVCVFRCVGRSPLSQFFGIDPQGVDLVIHEIGHFIELLFSRKHRAIEMLFAKRWKHIYNQTIASWNMRCLNNLFSVLTSISRFLIPSWTHYNLMRCAIDDWHLPLFLMQFSFTIATAAFFFDTLFDCHFASDTWGPRKLGKDSSTHYFRFMVAKNQKFKQLSFHAFRKITYFEYLYRDSFFNYFFYLKISCKSAHEQLSRCNLHQYIKLSIHTIGKYFWSLIHHRKISLIHDLSYRQRPCLALSIIITYISVAIDVSSAMRKQARSSRFVIDIPKSAFCSLRSKRHQHKWIASQKVAKLEFIEWKSV